ncbi:MAG: helix-turn-helix transcriptional regulator [Nitrospirae bacterium]|nr:helix-turn-helix transcriptional regulator [Nitrospirota bacterium]
MLLEKRELCVCQIMGVLNMSQPLISRNLSLLAKAGFLSGRRDGKLMFYKVKRNLNKENMLVLSILKELLKDDRVLIKDFKSLKECEEFQKRTGKCDMETFKAFMKQNKEKEK